VNDFQPIQPGGTIGMLGGGQLGRMFMLAARRMGYRVVVLTEEADGPAAQVADRVVVGDYSTRNLDTLALCCDVVTLEFENIPDAAVRQLAGALPTYPSANLLRIAQDRSLEKQSLADMGLPVTPFRTIDDLSTAAGGEQLRQAATDFGWPVIIKTARSGYDGKGQQMVRDAEHFSRVAADFGSQRVVVEQRIAFDREVSVLVARNPQGEVAVYPLLENEHRNHILDVSKCPATASPELEQAATEIAQTVARELRLVGILCIELFVVDGQKLMINEIAPRPHNSGHLTIEAATTSQFEQHVRAVCGLPLGSTQPLCPAAMVNLLGDLWEEGTPRFADALAVPGVTLHLYGKSTPRSGRKMGHLTAVGSSIEEAEQRARSAYVALKA